ncbi:restriction endonuclease subunit S [Sulfurovum sp. bin170]|uniref:restriction endonuclease subunit S n=1 Tax=Sulfurovum sp. bin170 TaxID=2695268 RepID=UPI0013DEA8E9|nr:restriction endonuclease subunit S [Sulfurovum sp. bin170]NEW59825.1 restriction endonuclease subunit S [Sulfurovum sp. bin170]
MSKYEVYPSYRDSGVEWLGKIPEDWEVKKLKYNLTLQTDKVTIINQQVIALENIASWSGQYIPTDSKYQGDDVEFKEDDVLFGKLRPYLAKVYQCQNSGVAFGDILVYRPTKQTESRFAFYAMISEAFIDIVDGSTYGSKMPRASVDFVSNMPIVIPPLQEQQAIANYLDIATAKIDTLIEKQIKLIELLKEKRQAVISTAVTRGLDSTVTMKDSGVEWLGEIPEHWTIGKIKHYGIYRSGDFISADNIEVEGNYPVLGGNGLRGYSKAYNLKGNYVLIGRQGALCGNINYSKDKFWATEHAIVVHNNKNIDVKWLGEILRTMNLNQYSVSAAQPGLAVENIINLTGVQPPLEEQQEIAKYIDEKTSKIDNLTTKSTKAIELLKEKRTALISSAVTGKIDVREIA